jgi:hypothetical protein
MIQKFVSWVIDIHGDAVFVMRFGDMPGHDQIQPHSTCMRGVDCLVGMNVESIFGPDLKLEIRNE